MPSAALLAGKNTYLLTDVEKRLETDASKAIGKLESDCLRGTAAVAFVAAKLNLNF